MYEMKKSENDSQNHSKSAIKIKKIKMKIKTDKKSTWYGVVQNCRSC